MRKKKAQSDIINVVLIILLVLAALIIVWQVVQRNVKEGGKEVETKTDCFQISMEIANVDISGDTVTIRRGPGGNDVDVTGYKIIVGNNYLDQIITLGPLETNTVAITVNSGDKVEVAAIIGGNIICPVTDYATA